MIIIGLGEGRLRSERGGAEGKAAFKHEGHGGINLVRGQGSGDARFVTGAVGAVTGHLIMQRGAAGRKTARLGIIDPCYQAHKFAHDVAMEPGWAERVLRHHPARREDDEVAIGGARRVAGAGQDSEDGRVGMVIADRVDRVEATQIIAAGGKIAVPGDNVEWAVRQAGGPELALEFLDEIDRRIDILEPGDRRFEIARIGEAVRSDRAKVGQAEGRAVIFADIAACDRGQQFDAEAQAARDESDLERRYLETAEFGDKADRPFLRHDQHLAVGIEEGAALH